MSSENEHMQVPARPTGEEVPSRGSRVKKRIRIKKKKSPKRKIRKMLENLVWVIITLIFVATLVYLLQQLDITDRRFKKKSVFLDRPVHMITDADKSQEEKNA